MMFPGAIVNSGRHLDEHRQIACSEIERVVRAAEVEATVRSKAPLGIFAGMSFMLLLQAIQAQWTRVARQSVIEAFAVVELRQTKRNGSSACVALRCNYLARLRPQPYRTVNAAERLARYALV